MEIKYLGHSSFRLKAKTGMVVVTDPFDTEAVGLVYGKQMADIVTVSHKHKDHSALEKITGPVKREEVFVINEAGEYEVGGVEIIAFKSFHDDKEGKERGENLMMIIRANGVIVAHLGDLGHLLSDRQIEQIGSVDVLMVPVGGVYTIDSKQALELISQMNPSLVIPMHYKVKGIKQDFSKLETIDDFLKKNSFEVQEERVDKIKVEKNSLPEDTQIVVMNGNS